jgi:hypothetical protein
MTLICLLEGLGNVGLDGRSVDDTEDQRRDEDDVKGVDDVQSQRADQKSWILRPYIQQSLFLVGLLAIGTGLSFAIRLAEKEKAQSNRARIELLERTKIYRPVSIHLSTRVEISESGE